MTRTRKVPWRRNRVQYVVHLDELCHAELRWVSEQTGHTLAGVVRVLVANERERLELEAKRRASPTPWERPAFWDKERP